MIGRLTSSSSSCDPQLLQRYLAGAGTHQELEAVERHLDVCTGCRESIEQQAASPDFWTAATRNLNTRLDTPFPTFRLDRAARAGDDIEFTSDHYLEQWLEASDSPDSLGTLGKYEVLAVIGHGGMGLVLKAYDPELQRVVAIKTLRPHLIGSEVARKRFAREAQLAAALRHPNVIAIYNVDAWRNVPYMVMPFVDDGTLYAFVQRRRIELDEILQVAYQVACGLAAAHAQGMVHRDIKPSNILLQGGLDSVVLSDFGLARASDDQQLTHSGLAAGTPQFMSPEQARGGIVDTRSDLFSLGSLLYWLCTSRSPFHADTSFGTLLRIVGEAHSPLRQLRPDIPVWFERLVDLLLVKAPEDRRLGAERAAELLKQCIEHRKDPLANPLPDELVRRQSRSWVRRGWILAVAGLVIAAGVWWLAKPAAPKAGALAPPEADVAEPDFPGDMRYGPLDVLDEVNMLADLKSGVRQQYWLRRMAYLPVADIPPSVIPAIEALADEEDATIKELALVILNKNPFEAVDDVENPFQVVE